MAALRQFPAFVVLLLVAAALMLVPALHAALNTPDRQIMGPAQEEWLAGELSRSKRSGELGESTPTSKLAGCGASKSSSFSSTRRLASGSTRSNSFSRTSPMAFSTSSRTMLSTSRP